jgi:hypothetical protein
MTLLFIWLFGSLALLQGHTPQPVSRPGIARLHGGPFLKFTSLRRQADNVIQLGLSVASGARFVVQASDDLNNWFSIGTNVASTVPLEIQDQETVNELSAALPPSRA